MTLSLTINETLKWLSSPHILCRSHSGGDSVAISIIVFLFPHLHNPFTPSLISLTVSVDVKHHVYLLSHFRFRFVFLVTLPRLRRNANDPTYQSGVVIDSPGASSRLAKTGDNVPCVS